MPTKTEITIGDREHRARSLEEMRFAASLHPCATCGAVLDDLVVSGERDTRVLHGDCRFCGTPATFTFVVEGDPSKMLPRRHELGDDRPSTIVEPRALTAELERLREAGIDDTNRDRALTCINELLKFVLIRDGERGDVLRAERNRLLPDVKDPLPRAPRPPKETNIDTIVRALFFVEHTPASVGGLEEALGVRVDFDVKRFWPRSKTEVTLSGFVKNLTFQPFWDIHHQEPPKDAEDARRFALVEWSVVFAIGFEVFARALERAEGPPNAGNGCHLYGEHWVLQARGPEVMLTWARRIPDWARAFDPRARETALADLARTLRAGGDLASAVAAIPKDAGIVVGKPSHAQVRIEFAPAMRILELARIVGWPEVVAVSHDIHSAQHYVYVRAPGGPAPARVSPTIGRWTVELSVDGYPTGGVVDGKDRPNFLQTRGIGPEDLVRHCRIRA